MKYFRYHLYDSVRCERTVGVIAAYSEEEAMEIAIRHLHKENIEIEELKFSEDGFCEIFYG